jgi:hypothetical protein
MAANMTKARGFQIAPYICLDGDWVSDAAWVAHRDLAIFGQLWAAVGPQPGWYSLLSGAPTWKAPGQFAEKIPTIDQLRPCIVLGQERTLWEVLDPADGRQYRFDGQTADAAWITIDPTRWQWHLTSLPAAEAAPGIAPVALVGTLDGEIRFILASLRDRWKRDKDLKRNGELCRAIKARDRHLCRYCGDRVNWADKKGRLAGTYDHVDPDGDNSFHNVVVACKRCNGIKKDRTPEQAGMPLYLPGTTAAAIAAGTAREVAASAAQDSAPEPRARSHDPDPIWIGSGSGPGSARAPARDRTEPDRARSDPDRTNPPHAGESTAHSQQPQSQEGSTS